MGFDVPHLDPFDLSFCRRLLVRLLAIVETVACFAVIFPLRALLLDVLESSEVLTQLLGEFGMGVEIDDLLRQLDHFILLPKHTHGCELNGF